VCTDTHFAEVARISKLDGMEIEGGRDQSEVVADDNSGMS